MRVDPVQPLDVPDLHDLYGAALRARAYESTRPAKRAKSSPSSHPGGGSGRKMLTMLFETGHPWITFKGRLQPALAAAARRRGA